MEAREQIIYRLTSNEAPPNGPIDEGAMARIDTQGVITYKKYIKGAWVDDPGAGSGDLKSDGSVVMSPGYVPDQPNDISTVHYVESRVIHSYDGNVAPDDFFASNPPANPLKKGDRYVWHSTKTVTSQKADIVTDAAFSDGDFILRHKPITIDGQYIPDASIFMIFMGVNLRVTLETTGRVIHPLTDIELQVGSGTKFKLHSLHTTPGATNYQVFESEVLTDDIKNEIQNIAIGTHLNIYASALKGSAAGFMYTGIYWVFNENIRGLESVASNVVGDYPTEIELKAGLAKLYNVNYLYDMEFFMYDSADDTATKGFYCHYYTNGSATDSTAFAPNGRIWYDALTLQGQEPGGTTNAQVFLADQPLFPPTAGLTEGTIMESKAYKKYYGPRDVDKNNGSDIAAITGKSFTLGGVDYSGIDIGASECPYDYSVSGIYMGIVTVSPAVGGHTRMLVMSGKGRFGGWSSTNYAVVDSAPALEFDGETVVEKAVYNIGFQTPVFIMNVSEATLNKVAAEATMDNIIFATGAENKLNILEGTTWFPYTTPEQLFNTFKGSIIALGAGAASTYTGDRVIAIGGNAGNPTGGLIASSICIGINSGKSVSAALTGGIFIGTNSAGDREAVCIGHSTKTYGSYGVSIGNRAESKDSGVSIGYGMKATGDNAVAIGVTGHKDGSVPMPIGESGAFFGNKLGGIQFTGVGNGERWVIRDQGSQMSRSILTPTNGVYITHGTADPIEGAGLAGARYIKIKDIQGTDKKSSSVGASRFTTGFQASGEYLEAEFESNISMAAFKLEGMYVVISRASFDPSTLSSEEGFTSPSTRLLAIRPESDLEADWEVLRHIHSITIPEFPFPIPMTYKGFDVGSYAAISVRPFETTIADVSAITFHMEVDIFDKIGGKWTKLASSNVPKVATVSDIVPLISSGAVILGDWIEVTSKSATIQLEFKSPDGSYWARFMSDAGVVESIKIQ